MLPSFQPPMFFFLKKKYFVTRQVFTSSSLSPNKADITKRLENGRLRLVPSKLVLQHSKCSYHCLCCLEKQNTKESGDFQLWGLPPIRATAMLQSMTSLKPQPTLSTLDNSHQDKLGRPAPFSTSSSPVSTGLSLRDYWLHYPPAYF